MNKKPNISYVFSSNGKTITFVVDGEIFSINHSHHNYQIIKNKLKDKSLFSLSLQELQLLFNVQKAIEQFVEGNVKVVDGQILYKGKRLHSTLVDRTLALMKEGFPFKNMLKFLDNLMENPSSSSVKELYDFLENKGLPITEDGCFLAYKAVRQDFRDIFSGKYLNTVGSILEMPRNEVDDQREKTCSFGFHVGALDYVRSYGAYHDTYLIVKVNPKDCVSVPTEHHAQKLRVCRYEVLQQMENPNNQLDKACYTSEGNYWTEANLKEELKCYLRYKEDATKIFFEIVGYTPPGYYDKLDLIHCVANKIITDKWSDGKINSFLESLDWDYGYEDDLNEGW